MMRQTTRWFLVSFVALFGAAGGCGRAERSTGSQTNWLNPCNQDADCGAGECWCHVCSAPCAADDECASGSCRATEDLGCAGPSTSPLLCVVECSTQADCRGRGPGIECVNGACLPTQAPGAAGAGTGGTGGATSGGAPSAGAGGSAKSGAGGSAKSGAGGSAKSGAGGASSGSGNATAGEAGQGGAPPEGPVGPRLAVAGNQACFVSGGKVYCLGDNQRGQLGVAPPFQAFLPTGSAEVPYLNDIAGVAVSGFHSCAFTNSGQVYCWGANDSNEVGSPSATPLTCTYKTVDQACQPTPTLVPGVDHVVGLALNNRVSCAVISDGSVRCWGDASDLEPWLSTLASVKSLSIGKTARDQPLIACAALEGGELSCNFDLPVEVSAWGKTRTLKLGGVSTGAVIPAFGCALGTDGGVTCFGDDSSGQLGDSAGAASRALAEGVTDLAVGANHACALLSDGRLECWGDNATGAAGGYPLASPSCGDTTCEAAPRIVDGLPPLVAVGGSDTIACGLAVDNTLWCWGGADTNSTISTFRTFGGPVRVVGPWEGDACSSILGDVVASGHLAQSGSCTTDDDCVAIPLDVPCDHTCDIAPTLKIGAPDLQTILGNLNDNVCPSAADAGCASPQLACPEQNLRVVCDNGACTLDDPERTGCADHCACTIERRVYSRSPAIVCDGFSLSILDWENCGNCDGSYEYVVVANRGGSAFDGDAVLSFAQVADGGAPVLPADRAVTLHLGPGAHSDPIRIDNGSNGYVAVHISTPGDCEPDDNETIFEFRNACP